MADTSDEILKSGKVMVSGQPMETFEAFGKYFGILKAYWGRLAACHVNTQGLDPAKDNGFYMPIYYADIGINLKAFRDAAQTLRTSGVNAQLQLDLIRETENLNHHWNDPAGDTALENYKHNQPRMEQDQQNLAGHAQNFAQVAENFQSAMDQKRDGAAKAVDGLINQALRNSPVDFENRLRTACESMEANNQGGGIGGFGFHQHLYQHHGAPGENWNANDVRSDIENSVMKGFAVACDGLAKIEQPTHDHIRDCYQTLLSELGATDGPPNPSSPPTTTSATATRPS
jgi:uncharacterized protein YukE